MQLQRYRWFPHLTNHYTLNIHQPAVFPTAVSWHRTLTVKILHLPAKQVLPPRTQYTTDYQLSTKLVGPVLFVEPFCTDLVEVLGEKPTPALLRPPQIPHDQNWDRTRAAAVGSQRPTLWPMARPFPTVSLLLCAYSLLRERAYWSVA
jgi:hypothetical protein